MTQFTNFIEKVNKILRFRLNFGYNSTVMTRSHYELKNQIKVLPSLKKKVLTSIKLKNSIINQSLKSSNDDKYNVWLLAGGFGGFLFTLFGWGQKEEDKVSELIMSIKRSIYSIQLEEYDKAEQLLHVALRQAQTLQHYDGITYVYDVMANLAMEVKNYAKAEKLFVSVMQRLLESGVPQDDPRVVHISLKMAKIFEETGALDKAEIGYEFCLKSMQDQAEKNPEDEDVLLLYAMSLDWYGKMLLNQSKFADALKYTEQAYHLCLAVHGREHEQTIVMLNDLGTISCLAGEHDRALVYLTSAAEIGENLPEMMTLGSIHVNLGSVYLRKGLYEEAMKSCDKGRTIAMERDDEECLGNANGCLDEIKKLFNSKSAKS